MSREVCKVVHSLSKPAWNVVGTVWGGRFKLARFPYTAGTGCEAFDTREKAAALEMAEFFVWCLNNREHIEHSAAYFGLRR